ncbi:aminopeptidase P family protein [Bifidobacterium aesculapii]|uniref:aminopeptidase P family protein n=1 Tax=Bifidobacterium aesculapii TaxID=1329411 RepID=UPI000A70B3BC|nr:aminopeptidase P family protein [Bifidobacterium aesculapii]
MAENDQTASTTPFDGHTHEAIIDRARRPHSATFTRFMTEQWGRRPIQQLRIASIEYTAGRRGRIADRFPGEYLVFPAGTLKTRSNDLSYPFRPHSAFAYFTGLGEDHEPNGVLVIAPDGATLFLQPPADNTTTDFYTSPAYGEYWVGPRPTLDDFSQATGIDTQPIANLSRFLDDALAAGGSVRVIREADSVITTLIDSIRRRHHLTSTPESDAELLAAADEARFIKDPTEVSEISKAVRATYHGISRALAHLGDAIDCPYGERVLEGEFAAVARSEGNGMPGAIFAAGEHTPILHWMRNSGEVHDGDLLLIDTGVESHALYAADISRTVPVNGTFTPLQRRVYEAVLDAQQQAFETIGPGHKYYEIHDTCMRVIATYLHDWGILPCSVEEALSPEGQQHRRWLACGVGHHLGLDVHDCSHARTEEYWGREFTDGMVLTIEPGLYFRADDLMVPPEFRGIGVRIEDDVLVTKHGAEWLSDYIPRTPDAVEQWVRESRGI